jgi:hypothetical protein
MSRLGIKHFVLRHAGIAWLTVIAIIVTLPALLWGPSISDSSVYNYVWVTQFAEALGHGDVYPRWLARSFVGLGSPTFFFYPPIAFYLAALFDLAGLTTLQAINVCALFLTLASGLTMYAWLRALGGRALLGAAAYMIAPYHLMEVYFRGALAEHAAFVWLPLIALGIRSLPNRRGVVILAVAYGGLVMTHLPVALLTTVFLVLPLAVRRVARTPVALGPGLLAGGLGLGLAAVYLIPALTLQAHISIEELWGRHYQVQTWLTWSNPDLRNLSALLALIALAAVVVATGAAFQASVARPWAALAGVAAAAAFGLVPFVWDVPMLAKVQFPWRLLCIVEFAAATALALAQPERHLRALTAIAYVMALGPVLPHIVHRLGLALAMPDYVTLVERTMPDAPEYLPRGLVVQGLTETQRIPDVSAYRDLPPATTIVVTEPGSVTLRRAAFPIWRVVDAMGREVPTRGPLLTFDAKPGRYRVERVTVWQERVGAWTSFAAVLCLAALAIGGQRAARHASVPPVDHLRPGT